MGSVSLFDGHIDYVEIKCDLCKNKFLRNMLKRYGGIIVCDECYRDLEE